MKVTASAIAAATQLTAGIFVSDGRWDQWQELFINEVKKGAGLTYKAHSWYEDSKFYNLVLKCDNFPIPSQSYLLIRFIDSGSGQNYQFAEARVNGQPKYDPMTQKLVGTAENTNPAIYTVKTSKDLVRNLRLYAEDKFESTGRAQLATKEKAAKLDRIKQRVKYTDYIGYTMDSDVERGFRRAKLDVSLVSPPVFHQVEAGRPFESLWTLTVAVRKGSNVLTVDEATAKINAAGYPNVTAKQVSEHFFNSTIVGTYAQEIALRSSKSIKEAKLWRDEGPKGTFDPSELAKSLKQGGAAKLQVTVTINNH